MSNIRGNTVFRDKNNTKETIWNKRKLSDFYFFLWQTTVLSLENRRTNIPTHSRPRVWTVSSWIQRGRPADYCPMPRGTSTLQNPRARLLSRWHCHPVVPVSEPCLANSELIQDPELFSFFWFVNIQREMSMLRLSHHHIFRST